LATATTPPEDGKTENVVPLDPTAAAPPATMVVEPPIITPSEVPSFWNVTPGAMAIGRVVAGTLVGNCTVLVLPSAITSMPLADGKTEIVVPDPTATPPPGAMVDPPTTTRDELPSFIRVTPGIMAMGPPVVVAAAAVVAGLIGIPLPPCDPVLTPGF
jgi:hypothetical protein